MVLYELDAVVASRSRRVEMDEGVDLPLADSSVAFSAKCFPRKDSFGSLLDALDLVFRWSSRWFPSTWSAAVFATPRGMMISANFLVYVRDVTWAKDSDDDSSPHPFQLTGHMKSSNIGLTNSTYSARTCLIDCIRPPPLVVCWTTRRICEETNH